MKKHRMKVILSLEAVFIAALLMAGFSYNPVVETIYNADFRSDLKAAQTAAERGADLDKQVKAITDMSEFVTEAIPEGNTYYAVAINPEVPKQPFLYAIVPNPEQERIESVVAVETAPEQAQPGLIAALATRPQEERALYAAAINQLPEALQREQLGIPANLAGKLTPAGIIKLAQAQPETPTDVTLLPESAAKMSIHEFIRVFFPTPQHEQLNIITQTLLNKLGPVIAQKIYGEMAIDIKTTKLGKAMEVPIGLTTEEAGKVRETAHALRRVLINPFVERGEANEHVINIPELLKGKVNVTEIGNQAEVVPLLRLLLALNSTESSRFYKGLAELTTGALPTQQQVKAERENFYSYMLKLFSSGYVTVPAYKTAMNEGTEAFSKGLKPFAGKVGFKSRRIRLMGNPETEEASSEKLQQEFAHAAVHEAIVLYMFNAYEKTPTHSEVVKVSNELAKVTEHIAQITPEQITHLKEAFAGVRTTPGVTLMAPMNVYDLLLPAGEGITSQIIRIGTGVIYLEDSGTGEVTTEEVELGITAPLEEEVELVSIPAGLEEEEVLRELATVEPVKEVSALMEPAEAISGIGEELETVEVPTPAGRALLIQQEGAFEATEVKQSLPIVTADNQTKLIITDLDALVVEVGKTETGEIVYAPTDFAVSIIADLNTLAEIKTAGGKQRYYRAVYSNRFETPEEIVDVLQQAGIPILLFDIGALAGEIAPEVQNAVAAVGKRAGALPNEVLFRMAEQNKALIAAIAANPNIAGMLVQVIMRPSEGQYISHRKSLINAIETLEGMISRDQLEVLRKAVENSTEIRGTTVEPEEDKYDSRKRMRKIVLEAV
ncbi:MAG: hypothetical protein JSW18_03905 [Candidatus Omnitrophota bacterium]|nr:MAG: hypothetical protein JSW18_03905 [Candidatus Omnitrophota bacterium]